VCGAPLHRPCPSPDQFGLCRHCAPDGTGTLQVTHFYVRLFVVFAAFYVRLFEDRLHFYVRLLWKCIVEASLLALQILAKAKAKVRWVSFRICACRKGERPPAPKGVPCDFRYTVWQLPLGTEGCGGFGSFFNFSQDSRHIIKYFRILKSNYIKSPFFQNGITIRVSCFGFLGIMNTSIKFNN